MINKKNNVNCVIWAVTICSKFLIHWLCACFVFQLLYTICSCIKIQQLQISTACHVYDNYVSSGEVVIFPIVAGTISYCKFAINQFNHHKCYCLDQIYSQILHIFECTLKRIVANTIRTTHEHEKCDQDLLKLE